MDLPFFTIGHSNRSIEAFVGLLRAGEVQVVVDVRKMPRSRANPHFAGTALADTLALHQIRYHRIEELGGFRGRAPDLPQHVNGWWRNRSFHNYADYALTDDFRRGFGELVALGRERRTAIMCAEAVWWRCHRRIIADHLVARGERVFHLMGEDRIDPVRLPPTASVGPLGVTYPAPDAEQQEVKESGS